MTQLTRLCLHYLRAMAHYPVVWTIIGLSCYPYFILSTGGLNAISNWFMPDTLAELVQFGAIGRLWTPTFVHYTAAHLVLNLYLWWVFASIIERQSKLQLILVVFISAGVANACQWYFVDSKFGGLSGVIYALLSYIWVLERYVDHQKYKFDHVLGLIMLVLIPISMTGLIGKFADYAHLSGLVCGFILALIYIKTNAAKQLTL